MSTWLNKKGLKKFCFIENILNTLKNLCSNFETVFTIFELVILDQRKGSFGGKITLIIRTINDVITKKNFQYLFLFFLFINKKELKSNDILNFLLKKLPLPWYYLNMILTIFCFLKKNLCI